MRPTGRGTAARRGRSAPRAAASRGRRRPGGRRSASTRPSRFANTAAELAIRPVAIETRRRASTASRTAAIVRSEGSASVVDEGPVDVEGEERIGKAASGRDARAEIVHPARRAESPHAGALDPDEARDARRGPAHDAPASPGRRRADLATIASPWSAPISSSATPSALGHAGSRSSEPADDVEAVGAAVERRPPARRRGPARGSGRSPRRDVRQVRADHGVRRLDAHGEQVGLDEDASGRRPRGRPRSRGPAGGRPGHVDRDHQSPASVHLPLPQRREQRRRRSRPSRCRRRRPGAAARPAAAASR